MGDKLKDFMRGYIGYLAVTLICAAYVATAFVQIEETGKTVERIVADGMLYFVLGILINRIFDAQGLMIGSRDPRVFETMKLHNTIVDRIYPFMNRLDDWCENKNNTALKRVRRNYLSRHGMRYTDYFDEDGTAKDFAFKEKHETFRVKIREHLRYRRYRHAAKMKITQISAGLLISDAGEADDPFSMGRSKPEYIKATTKKDIVVKSLTAFLFGYFGVSLITDFDWANLIWMGLQAGMLIGMGVFSMQTSIIYVTDEYRGRIIKKIDLLEQFETSIKEEEQKNGNNHHEKEDELSAGELPFGESE
jgi:hypothetical protein